MKRFLSVFLLLCMVFSLFSMSSVSASAATRSGSVGSCKWTLEGTILTISGNGKLDPGYSKAPWGKTITQVKINEGITSIGNGAFADCTSLNKVTLPNTLLEIGYGAFSGCTALTALTLPDSLTTIDTYAFSSCYSLIDIRIPKNVTYIGVEVFKECYALNNIFVDAANPSFTSVDGVLFSRDKTVIVRYPPNKKGNSYTVPSTVKEIGNGCFEAAWNLFYVNLPDSITKIGMNAFFRTEMYYDDSKFVNGCLYIGNHLIYGRNENMKTCTVRAGTKTIANGAFIMCSKLQKVVLPEGLTHIGDSAFSWCDSLKSIYIPKSVKKIDDSAFYDCKGLDNVYYSGTKSDKAKITMGMSNEMLKSASWKYDTCHGGADHKWGTVTVIKEADCTNTGENQKTCSVCSIVSKETVEALGHKHELWSQSKVPTCVETGVEESRCAACGYVATKTLGATGHVYTPWVIEFEATCVDAGARTRECILCKFVEAEQISAIGHSFSEWTTQLEPTCVADGEEKRTCGNCNMVETQVLELLGHSFGASEIVKKPTKRKTGLETAACTVCGYIKENVLPTIESNESGCSSTLDATAMAVIITLSLCAASVMTKKRKANR